MNWPLATAATSDVTSASSNEPVDLCPGSLLPRSLLPRSLPPRALHLWRWRLTATDAAYDQLWLTADERARAARYRFDPPRHRFVSARVGLRRILSVYLEVDDPCAFPFASGPHGKPALALPAQQWLRFNLAHTGDVAVCAICRGREVGIDVEAGDGSSTSPSAMSHAVRRFFSPAERAFLDRNPSPIGHAFLTLWTCKEAVGKASGAGLKPPIPTMDALLAGNLPGLPDTWLQYEEDRTWRVTRVLASTGLIGAVAVEVADGDDAGETMLTWFELPQPKA